ncbi:MAG: Rpn family recombination-promoting nuclease/putative transposase, partial [Candidatus Marinimicrobia bacterium]|nr:Rpn family recombination-promoting nuclease/putative transposase [Candidatus Neomarinimicrobiota bacterium]
TNELKEYFSDLLYKVKIDDTQGFVYLLFEHKSFPDKDVGLQLLEYLLRIWRAKRKNKQNLPPIIPLIIYHGVQEWNISNKFSDLIKTDKFLDYIPDFKYILYDLSKFEDHEIIGTDELRARLTLLRYIRTENFLNKFASMLEKYDISFLKPLVVYVANVRDDDIEEFHKKIKARSKIGGDVMMTIAEQLEKQGIKKGKKEGKKEGIKEGIKEGKREGKREEQVTIAKNMLKNEMNIVTISKVTGLSIKMVKDLEKEISTND